MSTNNILERGPFFSAAFICEKVLVEQDGVKSAIRIIDRIVRSAVGPHPPSEMEPFEYNSTLLLKFKSGWARGVHNVKFQLAKPSGELMPELVRSVLFEGEEDRGIDIIINLVFKLDQTGIYWIHVYLNEIKITQIPLRVIYMPQVTQVPFRPDNP